MFQTLLRVLLFLSVATIAESFASLRVGIPISANKLFTFLLLAVAGVQLLSRQIGPARSPKNLWLVVFGLGVIPSLATAFLVGVGTSQVVNSSITVVSLLLFYFLLTFVIREPRDVSVTVWAVIIGTSIAAISTIAGVGQDDSYYGRSGGLGGNPNLSALYAVTGIGFASYALLTLKSLPVKLLTLAFIGVNLLAIVQTVSRAGLLSLLVMGGFILVRYRRLDLLQFAIPAGILAGLAFAVFAPETYFDRIGTLGEEASDLAGLSIQNERIRSWYYGILAFFNYPLTGCGIKSFKTWIAIAHPDAPETPIPHSSYIRLLATTGLAGFIPWMAAVIITWFEYSKVRAMALARRSDEAMRTLFNQATFFQAVFLAWLFASLVSPFEWDKGVWLSFGLATALMTVARKRVAELERADTPSEESEPTSSRIESPFDPRALQTR